MYECMLCGQQFEQQWTGSDGCTEVNVGGDYVEVPGCGVQWVCHACDDRFLVDPRVLEAAVTRSIERELRYYE